MPKVTGHGYGLRTAHYDAHLQAGTRAPCVEIITENVVRRGGRPLDVLLRVRQDAQILLHGVSLSLGGMDPLDDAMLRDLRDLADKLESPIVSDHLCFGTFGGHSGHDLWPLPYTREAVQHLVSRIQHVQDLLGRRFAIENVSSYVSYTQSEMTEWEFLRDVVVQSGCGILLDINNIVVSAYNHNFAPDDYLAAIPEDAVMQYHLAGHSIREGYRFDDHGSQVSDEVLALYQKAVARFGNVACIVEWDDNVPSLEALEQEAAKAAACAAGATSNNADTNLTGMLIERGSTLETAIPEKSDALKDALKVLQP
jgi:uncharacterized protein